jgi:hypothetical protein
MKTLVRRLTSWQALLGTAGPVLALLCLSVWVVELRPISIVAAFALAFAHFIGSGFLWRMYVDGGADYDSEDAWVPGGLSKSMFMLAGFIVFLGAGLAVEIADIEAGR